MRSASLALGPLFLGVATCIQNLEGHRQARKRRTSNRAGANVVGGAQAGYLFGTADEVQVGPSGSPPLRPGQSEQLH
jgi:hypothetical protein